MTAPAAAPASSLFVLPALRSAPPLAPDRFAFTAMLDSLPGAAPKVGSSAAEEGSSTSSEPRQGRSPASQQDGYPLLGDGAFLSSLPFAVQGAPSTPSESRAAEVESSSLAPASTKGTVLEVSGGSTNAATDPAKPAAARLTGERAFHLALAASGVVNADSTPPLGPPPTDAPSFAPAPAAGEGDDGAMRSTAFPPRSQGLGPTQDAAPSDAGASLSPAGPTPAAVALPAASEAPAPVGPRGAVGPANPPLSPIRATAQDSSRGGRRAEVPAPPSPARIPNPAAPAAKTEPGDKVNSRLTDPVPSAGQSAPQAIAFGAPLSAPAAAVPQFGPNDAAAQDVAPRASTPAAAQAPAAPVKEIDVDLSPSGLEDVSMTMRLAGDRLSVVIRAASSQTTESMEGARNAIADRLAAIGQPLDSLIVRQTGVNADANTNGNAASADDGSADGGRQSGQGAGEQGGSSDASSSRRGAAGDRSF